MKRLVAESFAEFAGRIAACRTPDLRLLGTSGTVTTLASLHLELPQYDRKAVDGLIVPSGSMRDIASRLSTMSPAERRQLPCIGHAPTWSSPAARSSRPFSISGRPRASASPTAASARAFCGA